MTVIRLRSESYRFELPPHSLSHMHSSSRPLGCSGIGCTFFSPRDCQTFSPRDCQTLFFSRFGVPCGPVARPCARVWFGAMCLLRVRLRRARARRSLLGGSGRSPGLCVRAGARACVIGRIMRPKAPFGAKEFRFKLGYPCSPRSRGSTRAWRTHLGVRSHFSRGSKRWLKPFGIQSESLRQRRQKLIPVFLLRYQCTFRQHRQKMLPARQHPSRTTPATTNLIHICRLLCATIQPLD